MNKNIFILILLSALSLSPAIASVINVSQTEQSVVVHRILNAQEMSASFINVFSGQRQRIILANIDCHNSGIIRSFYGSNVKYRDTNTRVVSQAEKFLDDYLREAVNDQSRLVESRRERGTDMTFQILGIGTNGAYVGTLYYKGQNVNQLLIDKGYCSKL